VFESAIDVRLDDVTNIVHLYRIAQEAVSNAVKHGNSTKVEIKLYGSDDYLRLRISDNGQGFSEHWDQKGGLGVRIMQFRARLIGANLEIGATSDSGAIVTCTLPLAGVGIMEVSSPTNE
jgi:two-component system, LuxR family, sensor kinase FixL